MEGKIFNDNHNYEMIISPNKNIKLRSHDKSHDKSHKNSTCKNLMDQYHSVGIEPTTISRLINVNSGGSAGIVTS